MSKDNGNDGDNDTPNNVIPFPTKPKHISELLPELIEEFTGKLSSEQLRDFEAFIKEKSSKLFFLIFPCAVAKTI